MIATKKLKVLAAVLAVCGLLAAGGVGFAQAADPPAQAKLGPTLDDKQFLTKSCETLRGSAPTPAEMGYFLADSDDTKRKKVVTWLTEPVEKALAELDARWLLSFNTQKEQPDTYLYYRGALDRSMILDMNTRETLVLADPKLDPPAKDETRPVLFDDISYSLNFNTLAETDEAFLARVTQSARGGEPTRLEKEYFLKDTDAKKREKLLDLILSDPATAKKVGPEWKKTMLAPPATLRYFVSLDARSGWAGKLIDDLLAAKKTDEQMLEALVLASAGRLPTDTEKKLVAAAVGKATDKKAAWAEVAGTLGGTDEAKAHAEHLKPQSQNFRLRFHTVEPKPAELKK